MSFAQRLSRLWQGDLRSKLIAKVTGQRLSRDADYFARMYDEFPDPWHFKTSEYEQSKYRKTLDMLPPKRFRSAFEVGCSIGVFTQMLAERCDAVLAVDIVEHPLRTARTICASLTQVRFQRMTVPGEWPEDRFDLIVLSEVLYFLSAKDIVGVADRSRDSLLPGGSVLLANWRGPSNDPCTGDEAADLFIERTSPWLKRRAQHMEDNYRLDLLDRA